MPRPRWIRPKEVINFVKMAVWVMGLSKHWEKGFKPFAQRIVPMFKLWGPKRTVQYLKEAHRLVVKWAAGQRVTGLSPVRVGTKATGLPSIIPGVLRCEMYRWKSAHSERGRMVVKAVLTVFSIYRLIGVVSQVDLGSITDIFSGTQETLPIGTLKHAVSMLKTPLIVKPTRPVMINESSGPNYQYSTWGAPLDALAFLLNPLQMVAWACAAVKSGNSLMVVWMVLLQLVSLPMLPLMAITGLLPYKLGRLAVLREGGGKNRIVAIVDWWTQVLLKPLHDGLFRILRSIPQDGTFDQHAPAKRLHDRIRFTGAWSFDLSSATDRLPALLQRDLLKALGLKWSTEWWWLMAMRSWRYKGKWIKYSVGQPMGAYSSWAMLALTHHVVVQIAASRVGWNTWFPWYAIIGDDLIIADSAVAEAYRALMNELGLAINMDKSVVSSTSYEFAKRWVHVLKGEFSPLGAGAILVTLRNPRFYPILLIDALQKGCILPFPNCLKGAISFISKIRRSADRLERLIVLAFMGPTGGLIGLSPAVSKELLDIWLKNLSSSALGQQALFTDLMLYYLHRLGGQTMTDHAQRQKEWNKLVSEFWTYSLFGRALWQGILSFPLVVFGPGLWSYLVLWSEKTLQTHYESNDLIQSVTAGYAAIDPIHNERIFNALRDDLLMDVTSIGFGSRKRTLHLLQEQEKLISHIREMNEGSYFYPIPKYRSLVPYIEGKLMKMSSN